MKLIGAILALFMLVTASAMAKEDAMDSDGGMVAGAVTVEGYYLRTAVSTDFDTTVDRIRDILKDAGFGVLTEIDFSAKMKEKLDVDTPPCLILGACNPPYAWQVFQLEPWIGVELPCNVVVRQLEDGSVEVAMKNPAMLAEATGNASLEPLGDELLAKVEAILAALHE